MGLEGGFYDSSSPVIKGLHYLTSPSAPSECKFTTRSWALGPEEAVERVSGDERHVPKCRGPVWAIAWRVARTQALAGLKCKNNTTLRDQRMFQVHRAAQPLGHNMHGRLAHFNNTLKIFRLGACFTLVLTALSLRCHCRHRACRTGGLADTMLDDATHAYFHEACPLPFLRRIAI